MRIKVVAPLALMVMLSAVSLTLSVTPVPATSAVPIAAGHS